MGSSADVVVRYSADVVGFVAAWIVLAVVVAFGYVKVCRWTDRRRERELREILTMAGRYERVEQDWYWENHREREAQLARLIADADEAARLAVEADSAARDARAVAALRRDLGPSRRPPLVSVPDPVVREAV